jgi:uncharacterized protein YndB with AHSA1/START domain
MMPFELTFQRTFPHPRGKVWRALTDPIALGIWLMETNFAPEIGRAFEMYCDDGHGSIDRYLCKLLAIEPQHRMVWSWVLDGHQASGETIIEFRVAEVPEGTSLEIRHSGELDPETIAKFKSGWPEKLQQLAAYTSEAISDLRHGV